MTWQRRWRRLGVATVALVLVACSGGDTDPALATEEQIRAMADDARAAGFDRQAERLADGRVTEAEYRQGMTDAFACAEARGLTVSELTRTETAFGFQLVGMFNPGSVTVPAEISAISEECQDEHSAYIGQAWALATGDTFTDRARPVIVDCLVALGYDAEEVTGYDGARAAADDDIRAVSTCIGQTENTLNGLAPNGEPLEEDG